MLMSKWISVGDYLPEHNTLVKIRCYENGEIAEMTGKINIITGAWIDAESNPLNWTYFGCDDRFTHWMPLADDPV